MVVAALLICPMILWVGLTFFWFFPDLLDSMALHYDLSDMLSVAVIILLVVSGSLRIPKKG